MSHEQSKAYTAGNFELTIDDESKEVDVVPG